MAEQVLVHGQPCADDEPYNPKTGFKRRASSFRFATPSSPIAAQIEDVKETLEFFKNYRDYFLPYSGTESASSHALQAFLISLLELSPTHNACASKIQSFCFGGKVDIVRRMDPVYNLETNEDDVSAADKLAFYEFLKSIDVFDSSGQRVSFRRLAKNNYWSITGDGNYWIELQKFTIAGVPKFSAVIHRNTNCLYIATEPGAQRWVAVSPIWREDYLVKYPPLYLPLYPAWNVQQDGLMRTMVHVKNGDYPWYGRPSTIGALLDEYYEFQASDYKSKSTANAFIGQVFIEVEDADPQYDMGDESAAIDGYDGLAEQFAANHTNKAENPQTVVLSSRPYGSTPAYVFQFSPNTNEGWYEKTQDIAERNIIKAHQISRRILGLDVSAGMNTNAYLEEFEILSATVFNDIQETIGETINNIILAEAALHFGQEALLDFSLKFNSPFSEMLNERKENARNNNDSRGSGEVQPGE
mgnify:CR=1 FL=1